MKRALPALFAIACCSGVAVAKDNPSSSSSKKNGEKGRDKPQKSTRSAPSLSLEAVDFKTGKAVARVGGVSRPPDARLFSFHDDHGRHFIALYARCDTAPSRTVISGEGPDTVKSETHNTRSDDEFLCELDLPRPYLKSNVRGMTVHLHSREVVADDTEVQGRWAAARALSPNFADPSRSGTGAGSGAGAGGSGDEAIDDPRRPGEGPPPVDDPGVRLPRKKVKKAKPTEESDETGSQEGFDEE